MTKHNWFYSQLFTNWKRFEVIYVSILILLQLAVFAIVPDSPIGMISGVAGVICLVYGMKGRKISFIFGFIQCVAMTYVAWISHAYGSFAMDIVYVISQPDPEKLLFTGPGGITADSRYDAAYAVCNCPSQAPRRAFEKEMRTFDGN